MLENEYFFADQGDDSACEEITISYDDSDINMEAALTSNAQKDKLQGNCQKVTTNEEKVKVIDYEEQDFIRNNTSTMYYNVDDETTIQYQIINDNSDDLVNANIGQGERTQSVPVKEAKLPTYYINTEGVIYQAEAPQNEADRKLFVNNVINQIDDNVEEEMFITNGNNMHQTEHSTVIGEVEEEESDVDNNLSDFCDYDSDVSDCSAYNAALIQNIVDREQERLRALNKQEPNVNECAIDNEIVSSKNFGCLTSGMARRKKILPLIIAKRSSQPSETVRREPAVFKVNSDISEICGLKFLNRISNRMKRPRRKHLRKQQFYHLNRSGGDITVQCIKLMRTVERKRKPYSAIESSHKLSEVIIDENNDEIYSDVTRSFDYNLLAEDSDDGSFLENYIRVNNIQFDENPKRKIRKPNSNNYFTPKRIVSNKNQLFHGNRSRASNHFNDVDMDLSDDFDDDQDYKIQTRHYGQAKFSSLIPRRQKKVIRRNTPF